MLFIRTYGDIMRQLRDLLSITAERLDAFTHPRVSIAWQDLDLVYRRVHNPSDDIQGSVVGHRLEDPLEDKEQAAMLTASKRKILETGEPYHEIQPIVLGGQRHVFDVMIEPTYDENGQQDGLISINIDITDLALARERLKEANVRLIKLLDQALKSESGQRAR
jgi:two-component system, sensor histidine kinase